DAESRDYASVSPCLRGDFRVVGSGEQMTDLAKLVAEIGRPTVVVVGDAMLDRYVFGGISRISPEAPIQILRVAREEERPGGAASVAHDLAALGARVRLVAFAGDDEAGDVLRKLLADGG